MALRVSVVLIVLCAVLAIAQEVSIRRRCHSANDRLFQEQNSDLLDVATASSSEASGDGAPVSDPDPSSVPVIDSDSPDAKLPEEGLIPAGTESPELGGEGSGDASAGSDEVPAKAAEETEGSGGEDAGAKPDVACSDTEFGCCPDNTTAAQGPKQEGCSDEIDLEEVDYSGMNCSDTPFGCCPDNTTRATGAGGYGCPCDQHEFGCCPDGKTPAKGDKHYGCSCEHYEHGCCQDKVSNRLRNFFILYTRTCHSQEARYFTRSAHNFARTCERLRSKVSELVSARFDVKQMSMKTSTDARRLGAISHRVARRDERGELAATNCGRVVKNSWTFIMTAQRNLTGAFHTRHSRAVHARARPEL